MTKINFGGVMENVVTRQEFSLLKAREVLKNETIAVIGYGVQGPAQALNLRDNGFRAIVGQRKSFGKSQDKPTSWERAINDGWIEGKTLFSIEEAAEKGTIVCLLLSDAGQIASWPKIKKYITPGKALYFSHGFGITYKKYTKINPQKGVDIILIAPKGSGRTVRKLFLQKKGINASYAIEKDATRRARERVFAMGIGTGAGYLFKTTFKNEVYSDLVGERGVLMGAMAGIMEAQYAILRKKGHSPSEAFNETVEEATQSLIPLIADNGMDWMYASCSTTAQRGALDWKGKFRKAVTPVFDELYKKVEDGTEAKRVITKNSQKKYRMHLDKELSEMKNSEMWKTGAKVRELRPENSK